MRFKLAFVSIVLLVVVLGGGFAFWSQLLKSETKVLTGINFYLEDITVTFEGKSVRLQPYDAYEFRTESTGVVKIEARNASGDLLRERTHTLPREAAIAIDIYTEQSDYGYCFATANVSGLFYPEAEVQKVADVKILKDTGAQSFLWQDKLATNSTLRRPGQYNAVNLPSNIESSAKIYGLYPVDCKLLNQAAELNEDIRSWADYDPATLRDFALGDFQDYLNETAQ